MNWPSIQFELTRPWWLLGLLALPAIAWYYHRSLVDLARWQRQISLGVRAVVVGLLVLAMAGLTLLRPTREQFVVFAVDQSMSLGDDARKAADDYVARAVAAAGTNRCAVLPFAAVPGRLRTGEDAKRPASSPEAAPAAAIDRMGTDLAAALEVASAAAPPFYVPRIVLISDGNATSGDALRAAAGLRGSVEVSTVPLPVRDDPEVQVSSVNVPAQVQQGEGFRIELVIDSNHDDDQGRVEVYRGDVKAADQPVKLKKGENRLSLSQTIEQGGMTPITARIVGARDTLLDNNSDFGLVFTSGKPRILLAESDPDQAKQLAWALEEQDLQVDVRPARGVPETLAELQNYDLVILSNVPATALTAKQMQATRSYVQDLGGGLIMLGGDQSFGLGGYYKTTLEEILPVRSDFEKEKEKPSLAMMLVIDKSGSMGGEKIEMAKEAARAAVELLGPSDQIGVLAFEGDNFWVSELHPCSDKGYVLDRIAALEAGGGTNMAPAMEESFETLRGAVAKLKHVIILTDGVSSPGDFRGIAEAMSAERITVSTVAMGADADQALLEEIAQVGSGRYYVADDPGQVPQIFAKETVTASKSAINEQPFTPTVVRPSQVLADVGLDSAPFLLGYVITRPKPTSEVILATENGDPLLSWWRYGLGMSVAFTSDAKSRWGAEWLSWPQFGQFWAQIARHALRKAEAKGTVVQVERRGKKTLVSLDAIEPSSKFLNRAETELTLIDPSLGTKAIEMAQTAPGRYQAEFDAARAGAYQLQFSQSKEGQAIGRQSRGLAVGYPDELRLRPANSELLRTIAETTSGRHDLKAEHVFDPSPRTVPRTTPLWPYLVGLAGLLFVLDVALRRIDLSLLPILRRRFPLSTEPV
ncbi:VWA domain-containing protein [Paludisphaera rhizosphaerae]|uniref:VWA domain-containing protein n=1 Tax=Paludisphaera rhizosphaerae TaxID=2711216 RepID=UPI0013EDD6D0|nr:VWA domain-containing protein [Paludisphaera rhizosphaerae]